MNEKILNKLLNIFPFAIVFLYTVRYPINPDFGWHLKNGELLISKGIIVDTNFYSSLMDGFKYVNSSWIFDGLTYLVFKNFSFIGIGILSAIIFTSIFYVLTKITNMDIWQKIIIFPIFLILSSLLIKEQFTGQTISLLFMVITVYLLTIYKKHKKAASVSILLLMLVWANTNAQFVVGLIVIGVWIGSEFLKEAFLKRKIDFKNYLFMILLLFGSFLVTLLNPFGLNLYITVFEHFRSSQELAMIAEWASPFTYDATSLIYLSLVAIYTSSVAFLAYKKRLVKNLFFVLLPALFLLQAAFKIRYLYITLFLLAPLFSLLIDGVKIREFKYTSYTYLVTLTLVYFYVIYSFPVNTFIRNNWDYYCANAGCSDRAAKYLIDNNLQKDLYTEYLFGGWLIWKYSPEIKPLIDGRMHMWNDDGYSGYREYNDYMIGAKDINDGKFRTVYILKNSSIYPRLKELEREEAWSEVYDDTLSSIFVKR